MNLSSFCARAPAWIPGLAMFLMLVVLVVLPAGLRAQGVSQGSAPATIADSAAGEPAPISLSDIPTQAANDLVEVRRRQSRGWIKETIGMAAHRLPRLEQTLRTQVQQAEQVQQAQQRGDGQGFGFEAVQRQEENLRELELQVVPVRRELAAAALQLERDLRELGALATLWTRTLAEPDADIPPEILERARETRRALEAGHKNLLDEQALVLALQARVADITSAIAELRDTHVASGGRALLRLFRQDAAPVWTGDFWTGLAGGVAPRTTAHLAQKLADLRDYLQEQQRNVLIHLLLVGAIVAALMVVRAQVGRLTGSDRGLETKRAVFEMPVVTALLLALLLNDWIYPSPPPVFSVLLGLISAPVLYLFTRRLVEAEVFPLFRLVIAFFVAEQLRSAIAGLPGINRLFLLLESLIILLLLLRFGLHWAQRAGEPITRRGTMVGLLIARAMLVVALAVLLAGVAGFAALADFLMRGALFSAYLAIALYAMTRAIRGVVQALLHVPPLSFAAGVRRHREDIAARIGAWLGWAALAYWMIFTLQAFGLLGLAEGWAVSWWEASWQIGSLQVSVSAVLLFILIFGVTYLISRLVRFFLQEEIFSRVHLDRGLSHTVSTTVHYLILVIGFALALSATGIDMTRFAIVAGALTVGIGFGLQNIVNNFVSGLIVLFERPVKVGDTIQLGDVVGRVLRIGIRATVIESTSGAAVIIPNGKLISDQVVNWTLSGQSRQVAVPVIAKAEFSADEVKALLLGVAARHQSVLEMPAPEVLLLKRNVDTLEFELRVWTQALDQWVLIRSDLIAAIDTAFREAAARRAASAPPA